MNMFTFLLLAFIVGAIYLIVELAIPLGLLYLVIKAINPIWLWSTLLIIWFLGRTILYMMKNKGE